MFPEVAELMFSLVVGYMGALEFLYVVRHLYHWSFGHSPEFRDLKSEAESLQKLQDRLRNAISEANEKEALGFKAMKDGVLYKDGFRVNANQKEIDDLKEKIRKQEQRVERQREIEAELARQRKIEEETRKQLKEAEDELRKVEEEKERERLKLEKEEEEKRRAEEEENVRKILEAERKQEEEQRRLEREKIQQQLEEEENTRRILEAQKMEEERQRLQELEEEEYTWKLIAAEREREETERCREIEEENNRQILEVERQREERQRLQELEEENNRKLLQAEKEQEERQRLQELEEAERLQDIEDDKIIRRLLEAEQKREAEEETEITRKLIEAENQRENEERLRKLEQENIRKLLEAEKELQEEQRRIEEEQTRQRFEEEENYRRLLQMEREMEERERQAEEEKQALLDHAAGLERETAERLLAAEREAELQQRQIEDNEENVRKLLEAERELELKKQEMEEEAESLRRLIEAEKEMEERQRQIDEEALQKLKNAEEELQLRQTYDPDEAEVGEKPVHKKETGTLEHSPTPTQTVKTQYGQTGSDSFKSKTLLFPDVSEESSSAEPVSSKQSSFSTQQSSEAVLPELLFDEYERQAPDGGEDLPSLQYSDDYLRSLDGIKNKPLVREDGSGRRRAFKKRRSSGSSTSSRESRASREEELKMFTSLEEEELENIRKGDTDYETIKYTSESNLKVSKQHRRHKRSPAKDAKRDSNEATKGSLEMLDEEDSNPWGEIKPEHYKDTEFWKRKRNTSIDEELEETDAKQQTQAASLSAVNIPKMSSFEEATKSQHEEAISVLQRQRSRDSEPIKEPDEQSDTKNVSNVSDARLSPAGSNSSPASASASISPALISPEPEREPSQESEDIAARTPSPTGTSSGLRRSPRVDEMKLYKEQWKSKDRKVRAEAGENPAIEIDYASDEEFMPEKEYLMEGISDFYDFNASINPSRSRSRSRSKTPAVNRSVSPHQRRTPSPQNSSHNPGTTKSRSPSPDPASYKFIYERILPNLAADQQDIDGLSDFYDFNSKLNRDSLTGSTTKRSNEVHRTSVDYVIEDLKDDKPSGIGNLVKQIDELRRTPTTPDYERSISAEWRDIQKLKEELLSGTFKRSTYVGESMDFSDQFESLREEAKTFRRSRSRSRSTGHDIEEMTKSVLDKKELQEKILGEITKTSENLEDFSCDITKSFVDRNRRASDTALIQKPEILFQIQDLIQESDESLDVLEAEEYHHFRRFSLNQEEPVEQYPEDYMIEVKSLGDLRTWTGDVESPIVDGSAMAVGSTENLSTRSEEQKPHEDVVEEAYESGSDDERQTVVEVEDEIDEDIWDYNERPEESHNEQSECEEADRELDRYAGRHADDWRDVEGAVGGVLDEDSFQIDQIYDEAIKNRKPSGILRDYDSILQGIQISDADRLDVEETITNGNGSNSLYSPRSRSSRASSGDSSRSFLENERRDNERERRYLGDATMSAINSTRLRSRYGIVPSTSFTTTYDDDTEIDINYVPKKEYNWRKNFKLDDEVTEKENENENHVQYLDSRKFSLGGESITLFSRSPEHSGEEGELKEVTEADEADEAVKEQVEEETQPEPDELAIEKISKKKKNRRRSRKGSKGSIGENNEEVESASRRNSIIPEEDLQKNKSRRESKGTADVADVNTPLQDEEMEDSQPKKKSKKRRKPKQETTLPNLEIRLPSPEKKPGPPSVAALRAALSTTPVEIKPMATPGKLKKPDEPLREEKSSVSPRLSPKETEENSSVSPRQSLKVESQPNPSTICTSASPPPTTISAAVPNGEPLLLRSKTPELPFASSRTQSPTLAIQSPVTPSKSDENSTKDTAKITSDIIKDGGLYPLF